VFTVLVAGKKELFIEQVLLLPETLDPVTRIFLLRKEAELPAAA
jgi:hypothetical protein